MKIYTINGEDSKIEVLCSFNELNTLTDMLIDMRDKISDFLSSEKKLNASFLGHKHYRYGCENWEENDGDIAFYISWEGYESHKGD